MALFDNDMQGNNSFLDPIDFGHFSGLEMAGPSNGEFVDSFGAPISTYTPLQHSSSTDSQTISPSEMHISAPASGALTYQSTPQTDLMDSPYTGYYSTETSPAWAFTESPAVHDDMEFDHAISAGQVFPPIPGSSNEAVTAPKPVENKVVAMARKDSSPGKASPSSRLSISGGITKKKKKSKVLPPLVVKDPNDLKEIKKNRNTMAARQSRARKSQRFAQLKVDALTWKQRALDSGWHPRNEEEAAHLMKEIELEEDEAELV